MTAPAPTMVAADLDTHAGYNPALARKAQSACAFIAYPSAPTLTKLIGPNGTFILPDSYRSSGRVSDDGFEFDSDLKMTELRGMGTNSVLRRDVQSKDFNIHFSFLETHKLAYEVSRSLDLSAVQMSSDGEWRFSHPPRPATQYWQVVIIGRDGNADGLYYLASYYPHATLTDKSKEVWRDKEAGLERPVVLGADEHPVLKTACVEYLFGPGALKAAADMGITVSNQPAA